MDTRTLDKLTWALLIVLLICMAMAVCGCITPTVRGARVCVTTWEPDGAIHQIDAKGPDVTANDIQGLSIPAVTVESGCASVGGGKLKTWEANDMNGDILLWSGVGACGLAALALYMGSVGLAISLVAIGVGLIGIAYNPWIATISAIGGICYLVWSMVLARRAKAAKPLPKTVR